MVSNNSEVVFMLLLEALMSEFPSPWSLDRKGCVIAQDGSVVTANMPLDKARQVVFYANKIHVKKEEDPTARKALFGKAK